MKNKKTILVIACIAITLVAFYFGFGWVIHQIQSHASPDHVPPSHASLGHAPPDHVPPGHVPPDHSTADRRVLVPEAVVVSYEKQTLVAKVGNKEHSITIDENFKVFDAEGRHLTDKQIEETLKKDAKVEISLNGKVHEVKIKK